MNTVLYIAKFSSLAFATMVLASADAKPPEGQFNYMLNHSLLGCLSLTRNSISYDGNTTIVESIGNFEAKLGEIVIRSEEFERREVYENGRLVGYTSLTIENIGQVTEKRFLVETDYRDGHLIVSALDGDYEAPANIFTTNPIFVESVKAAHLVGSKTGVLHDVEITVGEIETVELDSGPVRARHYSVLGTSLLTDLWYDDEDLLVRFFVDDSGSPVEIVLTTRRSCED